MYAMMKFTASCFSLPYIIVRLFWHKSRDLISHFLRQMENIFPQFVGVQIDGFFALPLYSFAWYKQASYMRTFLIYFDVSSKISASSHSHQTDHKTSKNSGNFPFVTNRLCLYPSSVRLHQINKRNSFTQRFDKVPNVQSQWQGKDFLFCCRMAANLLSIFAKYEKLMRPPKPGEWNASSNYQIGHCQKKLDFLLSCFDRAFLTTVLKNLRLSFVRGLHLAQSCVSHSKGLLVVGRGVAADEAMAAAASSMCHHGAEKALLSTKLHRCSKDGSLF
ncbi:hypothetical protein EGR_10104 [Echinococcus granulosus]|uniref:Uncharacterized protein n=1 Tax=Echinococcus granulosus TaxID=6210 RepID=W6U971_ECHGR|nr:hypothetical protein EGR_10104 [Echinococcus granulosus]EUB55032.1 hypothetical protein EGR_10104 [Echinococcus granulosus]